MEWNLLTKQSAKATSTDNVYGSFGKEDPAFRETSLYSASKAAEGNSFASAALSNNQSR
ncbi:hypothetical protein [Massilia phyllosphaerae]|uniref:hypothetical protein n=1 Tax=Massilia phyllosphaerae TaxID=3106034 RepID=UPI002B1CB069|nr:hypothetical protein [Massilia sp. SGZ-792]